MLWSSHVARHCPGRVPRSWQHAPFVRVDYGTRGGCPQRVPPYFHGRLSYRCYFLFKLFLRFSFSRIMKTRKVVKFIGTCVSTV